MQPEFVVNPDLYTKCIIINNIIFVHDNDDNVLSYFKQ